MKVNNIQNIMKNNKILKWINNKFIGLTAIHKMNKLRLKTKISNLTDLIIIKIHRQKNFQIIMKRDFQIID